jgi:hypothetical protein
MSHDLVTEKVEIDPFVRGPAFAASKQVSVERARFGEIAYRECQMEARMTGHNALRPFRVWEAKRNGEAKESPCVCWGRREKK